MTTDHNALRKDPVTMPINQSNSKPFDLNETALKTHPGLFKSG